MKKKEICVENFTGIKKAVTEAKNSYYYIIYVDTEDMTVWCNTYASSDEWNDYKKNSIFCLFGGSGKYGLFPCNISMTKIKEELDYKLRYYGYVK